MERTKQSLARDIIATLSILLLVVVLFVVLYALLEKDQASLDAIEVSYRPELVGYVKMLQDAMSGTAPADAHRSGRMVILEQNLVDLPGSISLSRYMLYNEKLVARAPTEAGSVVLVDLNDYTLIAPAEGIHGARMNQSADVVVVDLKTGQLIARHTVWSSPPSIVSDIIGQPGAGVPQPIKSELEIGGQEIWKYLSSLPEAESNSAGAPRPSTPVAAVTLHYDGLYQLLWEIGGSHLRFYEDGTVLYASFDSVQARENAASFMSKARPDISKGHYVMQDSNIQFTALNGTDVVEFAGVVNGKDLILRRGSGASVSIYSFVEVPDLQP